MIGPLCGYVWGPINAEDLAPVPRSPWVITSGMIGPGASIGRLYAIHCEDRSCNEILPYLLSHTLDAARFGPQDDLDPLSLEPHGIDVVLRPDGVPELYVVNHGSRQSIEVFEILLDGQRPTLRWIGGVMLPGSTIGNDVAALAGGGFVVSTTGDIDGKLNVSLEQALAGEDTGGVLEWSSESGWSLLPGTQMNVANGVAVSKDGEWVYVSGTISRSIKKVSRGRASVECHVVQTDILADNLTWSPSGSLLVAGTFGVDLQEFMALHFNGNPRLPIPSRVLQIDPVDLKVEVVVEYGPETFGAATTALNLGSEIWIGAARDHGLACFRSHPDH